MELCDAYKNSHPSGDRKSHAHALDVLAIVGFMAAAFSGEAAAADCIRPIADVVNGVTLRASPTGASDKVGSLMPGQNLPWVASVPNWHQARLPDGQSVFASKRWVTVGDCSGTPPPPIESAAGGPTFTIDVFDVGTGLSVLVRGPDLSVLYDAGSNDDRATGDANRVIAYLKTVAPQLTTLTHAILSHPHRDHVELFADVINEYKPSDVWDSGSRGNTTCGYWRFLDAVAANTSIRYHTVTKDDGVNEIVTPDKCENAAPTTLTMRHSTRITTDPIALGQGASMQFMHLDGNDYSSDPNRNSLVVRMDLGSRRVLFMGDAEAGGRQAPSVAPTTTSIEGMLLACCSQTLFADVLIAGHHGSMTSSRNAFLNSVGASFFAISSGPFPYGSQVVLPDPIIVNTLNGRGDLKMTNMNDATCRTSAAKVGPDNDGKPGGCDAIRFTILSSGAITSEYNRAHD